jgi:hypothetical protein
MVTAMAPKKASNNRGIKPTAVVSPAIATSRSRLTPESPIARNLAFREAIVGQLFVAITIARLVGLFIAQQGEKPR